VKEEKRCGKDFSRYRKESILKKVLVLLLLICLAAAVLMIAGCGGDDAKVEDKAEEQGEEASGEEGIIQIPEGDISIEDSEKTDEGGKVTVEGEDGDEATIEYSQDAPSEEELGAPVYPNAAYNQDSGASMDVTTEDGDFSSTSAEFSTSDDFDQVVGWYEDRLGEPFASEPGESVWMIGDMEEDMVMVSVANEGDKVVVTIARITGMGPVQ
jgi:hypothetical protein